MFLFLQKLPLNFLVKSLPALFSQVPFSPSFLWPWNQLWCQRSDLGGVWRITCCDKCLLQKFIQANHHSFWGIIATDHKTVLEDQKPKTLNQNVFSSFYFYVLCVLSTSGIIEREGRSQGMGTWILILPQASHMALVKSFLSPESYGSFFTMERWERETAKVSLSPDMSWREDRRACLSSHRMYFT